MRLQDYLTEVTKIELLEPVAEQTLWQQYKQQGDLDSRRQLIEHYQPLVVKALSPWRCNEAMLMDLVQEGIIGLIESVENFQPERGVAFSLYAIHRIRGRMINYLAKESQRGQVSIDTPRANDTGLSFADTLIDRAPSVADVAEQNFLLRQLHSAIGKLPSKERLALNGLFLEEQEVREVASHLEISASHLYRLQKQGIRRVRGMLSRLMAEMKK